MSSALDLRHLISENRDDLEDQRAFLKRLDVIERVMYGVADPDLLSLEIRPSSVALEISLAHRLILRVEALDPVTFSVFTEDEDPDNWLYVQTVAFSYPEGVRKDNPLSTQHVDVRGASVKIARLLQAYVGLLG